MSVLEEVIESMNSGLSEDEIITNLKEQGISPDAINQALDQARIKTAISSEESGWNNEMEPSVFRPERAEALPTEGIISDEDLTPPIPSTFQRQRTGTPLHQDITTEEYAPTEENYAPAPQYEEPEYAPSYPQQEYMQQPSEYAPQYAQSEYMQQPEYGYSAQSTDTDTIIEIAEQVFAEKVKSIQRHIEDLNELKTLMQTKVDNLSDRLKRIELSIDRLQAEILEKVGSYGRGLDNVQKEMSMVQNSFGKMVGNLTTKTEPKHHTVIRTLPTHSTQRIEKKVTVVHRSGKKHSKKTK